MNARAGFADRMVVARLREADGEVDAAAIDKVRRLVADLARISFEAEALVLAIPTIGVTPATLGAIRGQIGMIWHELELARAALPLEVVELRP